MKLNISSKLWFTLIIFLFVGSIFYYMSMLYLYEDFYVYNQKEHLKEFGDKILEIYGGSELTVEFREKLEEIDNFNHEKILLVEQKDMVNSIPIENNTLEESLQIWEKLYWGEIVTLSGKHTEYDNDIIIVGIPLINNTGEYQGTIFLYTSLASVGEAIAEINPLIILYMLVLLLLGTAVAKVVTNRITKPLRAMETVANKMMDGDFSARVDVTTKDEVGSLGLSLNHLSDGLKRMIDLFHKEKSQLSQILDGMSDSVLTIDNNGKFILSNNPSNNLFRKLDISREDFIKIPKVDFLINEATKENKVLVDEIDFKNYNFILYLAPLIDEGKPWGVVLVIHDVTADRKRENDTREFLAIVSHEIRTPLSFVQGFTEALMDGVAESKETQQKYLQTIHDETKRMGRLVNDLLDLEQLEKGLYPMNNEEIILEIIIEQIVKRYQVEYTKKGVTLQYLNKSKSPLWMLGDEDRIIQIMFNLLDNALRHTPRGGEVIVTSFTARNEIILQIADTGEGIAKEHLDQLFDKFFRACKARTRNSGGTGLGLAIVKQIVEILAGEIEVDSELGKGTTITIFFPLLVENHPNA